MALNGECVRFLMAAVFVRFRHSPIWLYGLTETIETTRI